MKQDLMALGGFEVMQEKCDDGVKDLKVIVACLARGTRRSRPRVGYLVETCQG